MAGLCPIPNLGGCSATKFAVVGMSEALRGEMATHGVGVSVFCPGRIRTRLAETTLRAGIKRAPLPQASSQEPLEPEAIGAMIIDGIRENAPLIVSHGDYRAHVAERAARIDQAFDSLA